MIEIKSIDNPQVLSDICELLHKSQKTETENTGVLFNTIRLQPEELKEEIEQKNGQCICALEDGRVLGSLCVFPDNKNRWYTQDKRCLEIKYVGVSPESQGKHIGSSLINYVKAWPNYDIINVSTGEKNLNAISFYKKNDFLIVDFSRGPIHNACKLAYWKGECPIKQSVIRSHVLLSKMKCIVKKLLVRPKVSKDSFQ